MIEWNFANTYFFAAIITSLVIIVAYFIFRSKKK